MKSTNRVPALGGHHNIKKLLMYNKTMNKEIIKNSIDLHVHLGPDIMPRKYDLQALIAQEEGKLRGMAVKRHFLPATGFAQNIKTNLELIYSITLNNSVGGFNADAVLACAAISRRPLIVWFPTVHAEKFLRAQEYEIPPEWFGDTKKFVPRKATEIEGMTIFDKKKQIKPEVMKVLKAIKKSKAILATGHITWQESEVLVAEALKIGIKKIIITHPICEDMETPLPVQIKLADQGAIIEQCFSMYSIHKISAKIIAVQIRAIGPKRCIVSSDVGQVFSPSPSEAMAKFGDLLLAEGITEKELDVMMCKNPAKLVFK